MRILEYILLAVFALGLALLMLLIPFARLLIIASLLMLSSLYFGFGFSFFSNIRLRDVGKKATFNHVSPIRIIGGILTGVNLSILIIGILFNIMHWPGASLMLIMGVTPGIIILIIALIKHFTGNKSYTRIISRSILFLGLTSLLTASPLFFDNIVFRDKPKQLEMIKAQLEYEKNPTEENKINMEVAKDRALYAGNKTKRLDGSRIKHPDSLP